MRLPLDFSIPPPPLRMNNPDNGLAALVDRDVLDLDRLLAGAAMLLQGLAANVRASLLTAIKAESRCSTYFD
jgi:hypothetical protein